MNTRISSLALALVLALAACPSPEQGSAAEREPMPEDTGPTTPRVAEPEHAPDPHEAARKRQDPHSFARPDQVRVVHLGLSWVVDFDAETLTGDALLLLERTDRSAPLRLDVRDLDIKQVSAAALAPQPGARGVPELAPRRSDSAFREVKWQLDPAEAGLGQPLVVELPEGVDVVRITYATRPSATGLQWLSPEQTAGRKLPFLYSQSQAIHARSWMPSQDSPGIRTTWDAEVIVDAPFTAVMAAAHSEELAHEEGESSRTFRFVMPKPVPAYLLALAVGDLERRELSERTAVWADPVVVEQAASEFADMEAMLASAEALYGPYAWGRYDVLVLPPAFPFGGMENPCLTFATPTILAGDRSLVSLIAHELAHSWSGNLVTNQTWGDLWLNEGFTVYFERRIVEAIYGRERAEIEARVGKAELLNELADHELVPPEFQRLRTDLVGHDPDANFSSVPYEKGALLLRKLEETYGREVFDAFVKDWFASHAFGSVDTDEFLDAVTRDLLAKHPVPGGFDPLALAEWIDGGGLPTTAPEPDAAALDAVELAAKQWSAGELAAGKISTKGWSPWHWLHFLRSLPEDLDGARLAELDREFGFMKSTNAEILGQWLVLVAQHRYEPGYERMEAFLIKVGRRKFLMPIYRALATTDEGKALAKRIYEKARPGYHAISRASLDELLGAPAG